MSLWLAVIDLVAMASTIPPMEHRYSHAERRRQLEALADGLEKLIPIVSALHDYSGQASEYRAARDRALELIRMDFDQADLSALSRNIPDLFFRHKEWVPPLVKDVDGQWREPEWFRDLEQTLQPVLQAAELLRTLGYY